MHGARASLDAGRANHGRDGGAEAQAAPDSAKPAHDFSRWSELIESKPQGELAEIILEESGYTDLWRKEKTADAAGRLENLKELIRSMEEFPDLGSFLEHISLVMDAANMDSGARVSIMTLHAAKGLESKPCFCRVLKKACSRISARSMIRAVRGWRRAPPRLCRTDAREAPGEDLFRHQPAHSRALADNDSLAVFG